MIGNLPPVGFSPPSFGNRVSAENRVGGETGSNDATTRNVGQRRPGQPLSEQEMAQVRALQQRDREVRAHEMAHVAAGGELILRGAQYEYETGPDGIRYAVGGDVVIDTSPGRTPEETIEKARRIQAAALAPADPSPQDRAVAAAAMQMAAQAQVELAVQQREEATEEAAEVAEATGSAGTSGTVQGDTSAMDPNTNSLAGERMRETYAAVAMMAADPRLGRIDAFA